MDYSIACMKCGHCEDDTAFRCGRCNSILEVKFRYSELKLGRDFRKKRVTNSKYAEFFPVKKLELHNGEGGTPLVRKRYGSMDLLLKLETENPTHSFKDRGSAVEISKAMELGVKHVCCASTGNMGISVALYSRLAGIKATIFISKDADRIKIGMIKKHGARIIRVNSDFNGALRAAEKFSKETGAMVCGDYHYRKEGQKSVVFEIIEQMKYKVPDLLFLPVGNATLLSAVYKGLREFRMLSLIRRFPRIVAVQSAGCDPLVNAYNSGKRIEYIVPRTKADAIAVGYPTFGFEGIAALKGTRGIAVKVSDSELMEAKKRLKSMGIKSELGGAAGFAGFAKLYGERESAFDKKSVVAVVTGSN